MIDSKTITALEISNADALLTVYRWFSSNNIATADDLFTFLTTPNSERDIFIETYCACTVSISGNIVLSTYAPI